MQVTDYALDRPGWRMSLVCFDTEDLAWSQRSRIACRANPGGDPTAAAIDLDGATMAVIISLDVRCQVSAIGSLDTGLGQRVQDDAHRIQGVALSRVGLRA